MDITYTYKNHLAYIDHAICHLQDSILVTGYGIIEIELNKITEISCNEKLEKKSKPHKFIWTKDFCELFEKIKHPMGGWKH